MPNDFAVQGAEAEQVTFPADRVDHIAIHRGRGPRAWILAQRSGIGECPHFFSGRCIEAKNRVCPVGIAQRVEIAAFDRH